MQETNRPEQQKMYDRIDPLKEVYNSGIIDAPAVAKSLRDHHPALLTIDMQYLEPLQDMMYSPILNVRVCP